MKNYGKLTLTLIVAWFIFALSASALYLFRNDSQQFGLAVAIPALTPLVVFALWFALSENFRQFALSLDPRILTGAQLWRIIGFTFVLLQAHGLPAIFALPGGYGDMFMERHLRSWRGSSRTQVIAIVLLFGNCWEWRI